MRYDCIEEQHSHAGEGKFILDRCENILPALVSELRGKVTLIYLDPPFGTGDSFTMRVGHGKEAVKIPLYDDKRGPDEYLSWMRTILTACHELLTNDGSLYLHVDYRFSAQLRLLLDELFGASNFMNEIIWAYKSGGRSTRYFPRKHDTILFYRKSRQVYFDIRSVGLPRGPERRNHMKRFIDERGRVAYSIRSGSKTYVYYEDDLVYPSDVWNDIEHLQQKDRERLGYATQKPEALLKRILSASSRPGDLVLDLFSGSGTTAVVAAALGRRFLVTDSCPVAATMLRRRLIEQAAATPTLLNDKKDDGVFSIAYPADPCKAKLKLSYPVKRGQRSVQVDSATLDGKELCIVYAAVGSVVDKVFTPLAVNCSPKAPIKMQLPPTEKAALQLVDAFGRRIYCSLDPS